MGCFHFLFELLNFLLRFGGRQSCEPLFVNASCSPSRFTMSARVGGSESVFGSSGINSTNPSMMLLVSTPTAERKGSHGIALATSAVMTFLAYRALYAGTVDNEVERFLYQILLLLNFPSLCIAIMLGGVHNFERAVVVIGAAIQW